MAASPSPKIRILLVDDHAVARSGLASMLSVNPRFQVVAEADNSDAALGAYAAHLPQITLMDVRMPGTDGIETTRRLCQAFPDARVVLIGSDGLETDIVRGRAAGACGFVLKTITREHLTRAILHVIEHGWCSPYDPEKIIVSDTHQLSLREMQVLELMRRGLSNKDIGKALNISPHTVLTHSKAIFSSLGVANRAEAVTAAFERGYFRLQPGGRPDGSWED